MRLPCRAPSTPASVWSDVLRYAYPADQGTKRERNSPSAAKTNVLTYAFDLWERVFTELSREFK